MPGLQRILGAVMGAAVRRPLTVGLVVGLLAIAGAALALLRLEPSAATEQFVGKDSASAQATERYREAFGEDAVLLLIEGDLGRLVLTSDLNRLLGLEGCIAGNAPKGAELRGGPNGPCARLARDKPAKVVFGPATFLNQAVEQLTAQFSARMQAATQQAQQAYDAAVREARKRGMSQSRAEQLGEQARQAAQQPFLGQLLQLGVRYGLRGIPQLNDPAFVSQLVFDASKPAGTPKARFAYLFPDRDSAVVQIRMKAGLSEQQRTEAIELVRRAVAMPDWKLENGGRYVVTGAPVVVADLTDAISSSILVLLLVAVVVMALTLALVFRARLRLLPLVIALAATALTFGGLALVGAPLTMASIGVLPVLIGLAVDYAIQVQSRVQERRGASLRRAVSQTARDGAPTVAIAAAATAAGFLVLLLSPVPMVQGFGLLLVAGIALALFCALSLGVAALVAHADGRVPRAPRPARDAWAIVADAARDAGAIVAGSRPGRRVSAALRRRGELEAPPALPAAATQHLVRRAVAHLIDLVPIGALIWVLVDAGWSGFTIGLSVLAVTALLRGVLPGATGWTPGKLLTGLRVVDRRGRPPGVPAGLVRTLPLIVEWPGAVVLRPMRRSPWRQRAGDRLAGTLVVRRAALGASTAAAGGAPDPPRPWGLHTGGGLAALAPTRRPRLVLGIAAAIAVLGWGLDTQTRVESDILKLVPQDLPALRDLVALQETTGVGGQVDVVVRSEKLTEPETMRWMVSYQDALLKRFGFTAERGCGQAEICPAFSLPDLFRDQAASASKAAITELLDAVPAYLSQGVLTPDRKTATLAFGVRLMPLERQQEVIDAMRAGLADAPEGVEAEVAGLPVLAAEANAQVASHWRRALTLLAGLAAVFLVLLAALRSVRRAAVPLVPIALATGWSALSLFVFQVPLNPMSVTLGALVIAISTEFSVLLSERYRRERLDGREPRDALARTYRSTGAAVLASGATAIAGFAVLVFSDITMLRDFGAVTVVDLTVSLIGVLVVLPSVLLLMEEREARAPAGAGGRGLRLGRPSLPRPRLPRRRRRSPAAEPAAP